MPLSNVAAKNAAPRATPYKLSDMDGLYLYVQPNGAKYWRFQYRHGGKAKTLAVGVYPKVSLQAARERLQKAKRLLDDGIDPSAQKKQNKNALLENASNSFEEIATEWYENRCGMWSDSNKGYVLAKLKQYAFPEFGNRNVRDINATDMINAMRKIEAKGFNETAHRTLGLCRQVFAYAIVTGRASHNPASDLKGALKPVRTQHQAYLKEVEMPDFMKRMAAYEGNKLTKIALELVVRLFVRSNEIRNAEWADIKWDSQLMEIPLERMKMRRLHLVPLPKQAIAILKELQKITGNHTKLFPNQQHSSGIMSDNTLIYALYRMGYHTRATVHGFRATASTILYEKGFKGDVIERQLAHVESNKVKKAYNHAEYLPERTEMMQWWNNYLDELASKSSISV